ncbi:MAG: class I SAM-dependent methyltransferase [Deltaproteobacteria bacterium]|nr:class I SAM-dependent methyltransferase [Deltaproteobacteria bacterium]
MAKARVILKAGRQKSVSRRHPWIFSGALGAVEGSPGCGETVDVIDSAGTWLARGAYSPESQIRVRLWSWIQDDEITDRFFHRKLREALNLRKCLIDKSATSAFRLVNGESDGLPGIIIDRYGDFLVCQFLSTGAEFWKEIVVKELVEMMPVLGVYERSDSEVRAKEGLSLSQGRLAGDEPPELIAINEEGCRILVDVRKGHKTGFYLDQRENRSIVTEYCRDKEVLNCFSYTGGFSLRALAAGARCTVNIDSSVGALDMARRNAVLNGFDPAVMECLQGDAFNVLRNFRNKGKLFDCVILDPPKFADSKNALEGACRGYKDINLQGFSLVKPGGIMATFSCSGLLNRDLFQKIVADAAIDAGRDVRILRWLSQSPDHPTASTFPEGLYLKGLICAVL